MGYILEIEGGGCPVQNGSRMELQMFIRIYIYVGHCYVARSHVGGLADDQLNDHDTVQTSSIPDVVILRYITYGSRSFEMIKPIISI